MKEAHLNSSPVRLFSHLCLSAVLAVLACAAIANVQAADSTPKIKVLLVTGDDVLPYHNWQETAAATRTLLTACGKFDVKVCEDAGILESSSSLQRYDLIFLDLFNAKTPTLSPAARENLIAFVKSGKGFALSHLSSASFKDWDEFKKLCGRYWVMGQSGHGPRSVFKANIADHDSPITKGLSDFEADDELYAKLQGDAPIHVLVSANSDFSKKTEPLAFTLEYGQGRVFHSTFGHDGKALSNPTVQVLFQRGCEWAATGKVQQ